MERKNNEDWKTYHARKLREAKRETKYSWYAELLGITGWMIFGAASITIGFIIGTVF